jgi:hypothetical protein
MALSDAATLDRKLLQLADDNLRRGTTDSRDDLLRRAEAIEEMARRMGVPRGIAAALRARANVLASIGRYEEAIPVLMKASDQLTGDGDPGDLIPVLTALAEAQGHCTRWPDVVETTTRAIPMVERLRAGVGRAYLQSSFLRSSISLYGWGVRAAYELKHWNLMLSWAELSKCKSALRYQMRTDDVSADLRQAEDEFRVLTESLDSASYPRERTRLIRLRQQVWDWLHAHRYPRSVPQAHDSVFESLQGAMDHDQALVYYYWVDRHHLLTIALDRRDSVAVLRRMTSEYGELESFANFVLTFSEESPKTGLEDAADFSSLLLPNEVCELLRRKRRLLCSPHRMLHAIPVHALRYEQEHLIDRVAVRYIPNATSLLTGYIPSIGGSLLAIGICDYALPGRTVRRLRKAETEVTNVASHWQRKGPVCILTGSAATRETVRFLDRQHGLAQYSRVHFAVHGNNIDNDDPMSSYLLVNDGELDGLEISNWHLNADIVVLSACSSGQRSIYRRSIREELPGDELFGLPAAFFAAGAKQIVSAMWPVEDDVAAFILPKLHEYLDTHYTEPEVALQQAICKYRSTAGDYEQMIYFWAPLFISGLGRPVSYSDPQLERSECGTPAGSQT